MSSQSLELVGCRHELLASDTANFLGDTLRKANIGVEARAHGSAPQGKLAESRQGSLHSGNAILHLRCIAAEFLAQCQRRCVLRVCTSDLDDVVIVFGLAHQSFMQAAQPWQGALLKCQHRGNVHRCWKGVIGRLAAVDMVVGMHRRLATQLPT